LIAIWKKRWFSLKNKGLVYSREPNGPQLGIIQLTEQTVVNIPEHNFGYKKDEKHYGFEIVTTKRVWELMALSEKDLQRWLNGLKVFLKYSILVHNTQVNPVITTAIDLELESFECIPSERELIKGEVVFSNEHLLLAVAVFIQDFQSLCNLACVNKLTYQLSKSENFWIKSFEKKFGTFTPIRKGASIRETYLTLLTFEK